MYMNEITCRAIWCGVDQDYIPPHTGAVSLGISSLVFSLTCWLLLFFFPQMPSPHLQEPSPPPPVEFISRVAHILGYSDVQLWLL